MVQIQRASMFLGFGLQLSQNGLKGSIPPPSAELGLLTSLWSIDASINALMGSLPSLAFTQLMDYRKGSQ